MAGECPTSTFQQAHEQTSCKQCCCQNRLACIEKRMGARIHLFEERNHRASPSIHVHTSTYIVPCTHINVDTYFSHTSPYGADHVMAKLVLSTCRPASLRSLPKHLTQKQRPLQVLSRATGRTRPCALYARLLPPSRCGGQAGRSSTRRGGRPPGVWIHGWAWAIGWRSRGTWPRAPRWCEGW